MSDYLVPEWFQPALLKMNREHYRKLGMLLGHDTSWVGEMSDDEFIKFLFAQSERDNG